MSDDLWKAMLEEHDAEPPSPSLPPAAAVVPPPPSFADEDNPPVLPSLAPPPLSHAPGSFSPDWANDDDDDDDDDEPRSEPSSASGSTGSPFVPVDGAPAPARAGDEAGTPSQVAETHTPIPTSAAAIAAQSAARAVAAASESAVELVNPVGVSAAAPAPDDSESSQPSESASASGSTRERAMDEDAFAALAAASMVGRRPSSIARRPTDSHPVAAAEDSDSESETPADPAADSPGETAGREKEVAATSRPAKAAAAVPAASVASPGSSSSPDSSGSSRTGLIVAAVALLGIGAAAVFMMRGDDTGESTAQAQPAAKGTTADARASEPVGAGSAGDVDAAAPTGDSGEIAGSTDDGIDYEGLDTDGSEADSPTSRNRRKKGARHFRELAETALAEGRHADALGLALKSDDMRKNAKAARVATISACHTGNKPTALRFFHRLQGADQIEVQKTCAANGVTFDAPGAAPDVDPPAPDPAVDPAADPAVDPAADPAADPAPDPAADPAPDPTGAEADPPTEPAEDPAGESDADTGETDPAPAPVDTAPSADELMARARRAAMGGSDSKAYDLAKQAHGAGGGAAALVLMGVSACKMGSADKAKKALARLAAEKQADIRSVCAQRGVALD